MIDPIQQPALPPDPPRAIPKWFFVRRMQSLAFAAVFLPVLGVMTGLSLLGIFAALGDRVLPFTDWHLDRRHAAATARITNKQLVTHTHSGSEHPWRVTFEFTTARGRTIKAVGYTWDQSFADKPVGDTIDVQFDRDDPRHARPVGGSAALFPPWMVGVLTLTFAPELVLGLILLIGLAWRVHAERKLLAYGIGTAAEIEAVRRVSWIHFGSRSPYDVYYRFADYQRQEVTGHDRTYHYAWAEALQPGDKVGIVYNPVQPTVNVLWLHGNDLRRSAP